MLKAFIDDCMAKKFFCWIYKKIYILPFCIKKYTIGWNFKK
ncbi:hypothetical protein [Bacillus tequilensis]